MRYFQNILIMRPYAPTTGPSGTNVKQLEAGNTRSVVQLVEEIGSPKSITHMVDLEQLSPEVNIEITRWIEII